MKKNKFLSLRREKIRKLVLMHFLTFLLLLILLPGMAITHAQNKISIEMQNVSLQDVFTAIQQQSHLRFLYSNEDVDHIKIELLKSEQEEIGTILDQVLENTGLTWQMQDHIIFVKKAKITVPPVESVKITGKVTDKTGNPLPGVTVAIKGTSLGGATDVDGNYSIEIPSGKEIVLVFSFVGMKTREILYQGKENINVVLEEEVKGMDEVVVTGYFNKNKSSFTGTAKSYTAEELKQVNPVNLLSALSILDPSFKMVENNLDGSNPNVIPDFQIRGTASMPSTNELTSSFVGSPNMPTFIMDGFEVTAEKVFDLDPMRIESMTILKDAAATAIYGSRASNGVVVINTKQPEAGKLRLLYNLDVSFNIPDLTDYDLLNATEKLQLEKAAGYFDPFGTIDQTEARERDYNYRLGLVQQGYNTYWLDKPLEVAIGHKHTLSVEGGEKPCAIL